MKNFQKLLQVSAKLYQHLTEVPNDEERDSFIEKIHSLLDERSILINEMKKEGFQYDSSDKTHVMLRELDKGIQDRLSTVMKSIQQDLKNLQNTKKSEQQYMNPYASVQVMDGRYYDKKN